MIEMTDRAFGPHGPVLVTGGNGYIGSWLVKRLLELGHDVHATVRDLTDPKETSHLEAIATDLPGSLSLYGAELLDPAGFDCAMVGCEVVFHTASPTIGRGVRDPMRVLIEPATCGTRNVLEAVNRCLSVRRVVLTSSVSAIYGDAIEMAETEERCFNENHWNETSTESHQPYSYSKVLAERLAWEIAGSQDRWDLVVVNPGLVLGPALSPHATSESVRIIRDFGTGFYRLGVPKGELGIVDVRDVADAHIQAAMKAESTGRYILVAETLSLQEIAAILRGHFGGGFPFPRRVLPNFVAVLLAPLAGLKRAEVRRNVGYPLRFDNRRATTHLGMKFRPASVAIVDHFQQLIDDDLVGSRRKSQAKRKA